MRISAAPRGGTGREQGLALLPPQRAAVSQGQLTQPQEEWGGGGEVAGSPAAALQGLGRQSPAGSRE